MPELTREEKLKIFEKLPQDLQNLMESEDTGAFLLYLEDKYNLTDEQTSVLSKTVGDIILGIVSLNILVQEINSKVTSDVQMSQNLAKEINDNIFSPIANLLDKPTPSVQRPTPIPPPSSLLTSEIKTGIPTPPQAGIGAAPVPPMPAAPTPSIPSSKFQVPSSDKYREPAAGAPEIVDLRKTPPPPMPASVSAAPIPPISRPTPLTFTRPIEPIKPVPLIEAEPHLPVPAPITPAPKPVMPPAPAEPIIHGADRYHEQIESPLPPVPVQNVKPSTPSAPQPQYIIRPPGLPPTDLQTEILDLRKDKGEF